MKDVFDFPEVEGRERHESEDYSLTHPNGWRARTVLVTAHNLLAAHEDFDSTLGDFTGDSRKLQHVFVRRGANALRALYFLVKFHSYDGAESRVRYLWETYLLLRGLNSDRERAAEIWNDLRDDIHATGLVEENPLYVYHETDALDEIIDEEKKDYLWEGAGEDTPYDTTGDVHLKVWRKISIRGSHPMTIQSAWVDGTWSTGKERSLLTMGLSLAFGITAQYVRTYEDTEIDTHVRQALDRIFVDIRLAMDRTLPIFLDEEMRYWGP